MPIRLKTPEEKEFQLVLADPTGETRVKVRQATQREHEFRADLWATASRVMRDGIGGEVELKQRISFPEIMRREVFLTLIDCNIEDEEGNSLFRFRQDKSGRSYMAMNEVQFAEAWGKLSTAVCNEIHGYVLEVNPSWGSGE